MANFKVEPRVFSVDSKLVPMGYTQDKTLTVAKGLNPPNGARVAVIQAITQNVRWRDDGTAPTAAIGMRLAAGTDMLYTGDMHAIRFIQETATAELNVTYYH
jgi:hypothetical protein